MAKWPTKKLKFVDVDLYKSRIWFADSPKIWDKCRKSMGADDGEEAVMYGGLTTSWRNTETGEIVRLVGIFEHTHKVLVHECAHAVMDLFNDAGVKISADQQEPFCYLLEYIYGEAAKKLGI